MKIYFTAAISQKPQYGVYYDRIVQCLEKLGHKVVHEHITKVSMQDVSSESDEKKVKYYRDVLRWITEADIVIAETSFPSTLNVGHEVSLSLEKGKPVIALHLKGKESVFFSGNQSEKLVYESYTESTLESVLESSLEYASDRQDVRFNFFVSPDIQQYLDWVAKYKRTPRAVYLRELLERDMRENKEWKKKQ